MTLFTLRRYVMILSTSFLCLVHVYSPIVLFGMIFAFEDIIIKFLLDNLLITFNNNAYISIHNFFYIIRGGSVHVHIENVTVTKTMKSF